MCYVYYFHSWKFLDQSWFKNFAQNPFTKIFPVLVEYIFHSYKDFQNGDI